MTIILLIFYNKFYIEYTASARIGVQDENASQLGGSKSAHDAIKTIVFVYLISSCLI